MSTSWNKGNLIHGCSNSSTYNSWRAMRNRCSNPRNSNYPVYGGAGVTVCPRWRDSFKTFLREMGERTPGRTINRLDGSKGYSCGHRDCCGLRRKNCRWATAAEQTRNTRTVKLNPAKVRRIRRLWDRGRTFAAIARVFDVHPATIGDTVVRKIWSDVEQSVIRTRNRSPAVLQS